MRWEERTQWRGATARVKLQDVEPRLGGPLRMSLELHNAGSEPLLYDDQGIRLYAFEVIGPDGARVPYIGWSAQTFGWEKKLVPGATAILLEAYDISTDFLFERPGRYRVRFGGGGLRFEKPGEDWPDFHPIHLLSDWLEFTMGDGKPRPVVEVVRRLRPVLPKKWGIATDSFEGAMTVRLLRNSGEMGDEIWLQLGGEPKEHFSRIGEGPWGTVWLKDRDVIEPALRPALLDALTLP